MTDLTIHEAEKHYDENGQNFLHELEWHNWNGWVINSPSFFGMGYFWDDGGEIVLHVSYCRGDMKSLFRFSSDYALDKIEFKRNFTGDVKRYDYAKFEKRMTSWQVQ